MDICYSPSSGSTDRQTDQTNRRPTDRPTNQSTYRPTEDRSIDRRTDRPTNRPTIQPTARQTALIPPLPFIPVCTMDDTGSTGSCLLKFNPMPFMFCNIGEVCRYASRTATSYWLAANISVPMMPVGDENLRDYIGRCSVCQAPGPLLTVHSQSSIVPRCPNGWTPLWEGYSFVMVNCSELVASSSASYVHVSLSFIH